MKRLEEELEELYKKYKKGDLEKFLKKLEKILNEGNLKPWEEHYLKKEMEQIKKYGKEYILAYKKTLKELQDLK